MEKVIEHVSVYREEFGNYIYILFCDKVPVKGIMSDDYIEPTDVKERIKVPEPYTLELSIHQTQHIVKNMEPLEHYYV